MTRPMGPGQTYGTPAAEPQTYGTPATEPTDFKALWRDAIAAVRLLGSEVRRLRAELEER